MDDSIQRMIARIKVSPEGTDFLNYLKDLSRDNYDGFKRASSEMSDIHKGKALALDALIHQFEVADQQLNTQSNITADWGV